MKVCFIVGTLGRGGAEKQLLFMLRALKQIGVESRVLCLTKGESYEHDIRTLGIQIDWVGESGNQFLRLWKIIQNLRSNRADILQSSHFYTNIYSGLAGKFLGIPSIGAVRSDLYSEMTIHKYLGRYQISLPRFLIVNSKLALNRAVKLGISKDNVEYVQNVIDAGANASTLEDRVGKPIRFLFVGRLDRNKRPERFVHLAATLDQEFDSVPLSFQIVGDGDLRPELQELAHSLQLDTKRFQFLGQQTDMDKIYGAADILISTSEREGTSNVVLEAMAHGLAVIATDVGGTSEILNPNCGILVTQGDANELAVASAGLIRDEKRRLALGVSGAKYVQENHSLQNLGKELEQVYEAISTTSRHNLIDD